MSDLHRLKERIEQADGRITFTSDELFAWAKAMRCEAMAYYLGKALYGSIDAAIALVERLLPGWMWGVVKKGDEFECYVHNNRSAFVGIAATRNPERRWHTARHKQAALGLLSALLTALSKDTDHVS